MSIAPFGYHKLYCVTLETRWDKKRWKLINVLAFLLVPARQSFPYIIMCVFHETIC